jgi:hypothetical protein
MLVNRSTKTNDHVQQKRLIHPSTMLTNRSTASVRSAIDAFQRYKILNTLTNDCFESAVLVEHKHISAETCMS